MKTKRPVWIIVAMFPLVIVATFIWPLGEAARLQSKARKQWRD